MSAIAMTIKQPVRRLIRSPGFAATALLTLALGIGTSVALFTAVRAIFLKPLPYPHADRLVAVARFDADGRGLRPLSGPQFFDLQTEAKTLEAIAAQARASLEFAGADRPERLQAVEVSASYFEVLGIQPALGRSFTRRDEEEQQNAVILSYTLWMRAFGGDRSVVGRSAMLDGRARTIVGVAPAGVELPRNLAVEAFVPLDRQAANNLNRYDHHFQCFGRLRVGVSPEAASSEMRSFFQGWVERYPQTPHDNPLVLENLQAYLLGNRAWPTMLLMAAACLFLLIACSNVASLFLARALGRCRETAVRISLGAGTSQLLRQFLAEGLAVGTVGGIVGLALAGSLVRFIPQVLPHASTLNGIHRLSLDPMVLGFAAALTLATSVLFALTPMLQARRLNVRRFLEGGARGGSSHGHRLRAWLVVGEVALTTVLLVCFGLLLRSLFEMLRSHPGFEAGNVVAFAVSLPNQRYAEEPAITRFHDELVRRLRAIPGVESVGSATNTPLLGEGDALFRVADLPDEPVNRRSATIDAVGADYFAVMRIPILEGRPILESDTATSPRVVVVNQTLARQYLKGDPVGQKIIHGWGRETTPFGTPSEVVGVAADFRNSSLAEPPTPRVMAASAQVPNFGISFMLRSSRTPGALRSLVDETVAQVDPQLPILRYESLDSRVQKSAADTRQTVVLSGVFSSMALLLSLVGIYGVVSFLVAQRTREFGIRKALGAELADILRMVLGQGLRMVLGGALLGLVGALALGRLLSSQLVGISSFDPLVLSASIFALATTALLACLVPAFRAASVDPSVALREE